jgi:radical SAM protein with 4Fe4S-binding SPASM domain
MKREEPYPFPLPGSVQLYPTCRCNQNCSFCFNSDGPPPADLTFGKALCLLDILDTYHIREIDLMGGEPFLLGWMPDFIKTATGRDITVHVSTNGSLPSAFKKLCGVVAEKLHIGVSLEGSVASHHHALTHSKNFAPAIRSIRLLLSMGLDPLVKTVVNRSTIHDVPNIVDLLQDLGVRRYYLIHMDLFSRKSSVMQDALGYEEFISLYRETASSNKGIEINKVHASCFERHALPERARCAGGVRKLSVMPDGSVFPCNLFHHLPAFRLGNIFDNRFQDTWQSPKLHLFRNFEKNRCCITDCSNHSSCTGGCPAHGFFHYGNPDSTDIRCSLKQGHIPFSAP